jgi:hypothetical protein
MYVSRQQKKPPARNKTKPKKKKRSKVEEGYMSSLKKEK